MMKIIGRIIYWGLIIGLIVFGVYMYNTRFFNDYYKTMKNKNADFSRVKVEDSYAGLESESKAYKITCEDYNNALFYKEINVKKNTPYKVSCYIKTEDIEYKILDEYKNVGVEYTGGANICIYGKNERSEILTGTNGWQKLEFIFNSLEEDKVKIGFRLGTDAADAKGTVYFHDIKVEEGKIEDTSSWKFGMFVFKNINVTIDDVKYKAAMNDTDLEIIRQNVDLFDNSITNMSDGKIDAQSEIKYFEEPIKSVSKDNINGYYIEVNDVYDIIKDEINSYEYDHVFFIFKSDNLNKEVDEKELENQIDWVGLGGMHYNSLGYSNIRLPLTYNSGRHMFIYDKNINTFPEEVFVHEFLHNLERVSKDMDIDYTSIHSYQEYGYANHSVRKLKTWYTDFLNKEITNSNSNDFYGLEEDVYKYANLANASDFKNTKEIDFDNEPENIKEAIIQLKDIVIRTVENIIENMNEQK